MTTTNNTLTIHYLNNQDQIVIPQSFSGDFQVTGDKEVAKENFDNIMKEYPAWVESREKWLDRYKSIRESLEDNPNRDYILGLVLNYDNPNYWKYNVAQEDVGIGCAYSFKLIRKIGDGPYLFISGFAFDEPTKKIFEVTIALELV